MSMTDPIADYLTRIRNAQKAGHKKVDIPASNVKMNITKILHQDHLIESYLNIDDGREGMIRIYLKYDQNLVPIIKGLKRISKPGRRVYVGRQNIPRVLNNLGIALMSTSQGLMSNKMAKERGIGGEVICHIW
ncbi:MAG: 30S ribosomal protein S8 [bacterium]